MPGDPNLKLKNKKLRTWWIFHRITTSLRAKPGFIIAGVQKGGTTSLFAYLSAHPQVLPPFRKEIKYFDRNYFMGPDWYKAHFPLALKLANLNGITGEATPDYSFHPQGLQRIASDLPGIKIILIFRNPIDRAFSHYNHMVKVGNENLSFEDAIAVEEKRLEGEAHKISSDIYYSQANFLNHSYLLRGHYIDRIKKVFSLFPGENILILSSEELFREPLLVINQVTSFLKLPNVERSQAEFKIHKKGQYQPIDPATRSKLSDYFAPLNKEFYAFLGKDFGWD